MNTSSSTSVSTKILSIDADSIPPVFEEREIAADESQEAAAECDDIIRENKATNHDHDHNQIVAKERRNGADDAKGPKEEHDHDHNDHDHETTDPKEQRTDAVAVHAGTRRMKGRAVEQRT